MLNRRFSSRTDISSGGIKWLLLAQIIALVAHIEIVPVWLIFFAAGLIVLRYLIIQKKISELNVWVRGLLMSLASALFVFTINFQFTIENAVSFFILTYSLKTLELRRYRDAYVFVFLTMFLLTLSLLFSQSFLISIYVFIALGICFVALMAVNTPVTVKALPGRLGSIYGLLLLAIPLLVVFYLVFPRFGPLWSMTMTSNSAFTGLAESLAPGDVANLAQSGKRAFRVAFAGLPPPSAQLYWRTLILDYYDGRSWTRSSWQFSQDIRRSPQQRQELDWEYEVTVDPHDRKWAFALQDAAVVDGNIYQTPDRLVRFNWNIKSPVEYRLASYSYSADRLSDGQRIRNLRVPHNFNPRTNAWAERLVAQYPDPSARISAVLNHLNREEYYYTLKPPLLTSRDRVDEFLFESQRGFCEHFASSMAYLLRKMNIPARVVIGYQGGEWNSQGDFLVVRQYDAHAWVEAWIEGKGWVRYDPTAAVAPSRIESGIREAVAEEGSFLEDSPLALTHFRHIGVINWLRDQIETLNYQWIKFVVNYDRERQQTIFNKLFGNNDVYRLAMTLSIIAVIVFVILMLLAFIPEWRRRHRHPVNFMFNTLLLKLSRVHSGVHVGMTPRQLLSSVDRRAPCWVELHEIVGLIETCLYSGGQWQERDTQKLKRKIRRFSRRTKKDGILNPQH